MTPIMRICMKKARGTCVGRAMLSKTQLCECPRDWTDTSNVRCWHVVRETVRRRSPSLHRIWGHHRLAHESCATDSCRDECLWYKAGSRVFTRMESTASDTSAWSCKSSAPKNTLLLYPRMPSRKSQIKSRRYTSGHAEISQRPSNFCAICVLCRRFTKNFAHIAAPTTLWQFSLFWFASLCFAFSMYIFVHHSLLRSCTVCFVYSFFIYF